MSHRTIRLLFLILALSHPGMCLGAVPAYVLELPDSVADIFVADATKATLYRYSQTPSGLVLADSSYVSIGQNGAGKQRAWDRKTPLGIYFVVDQLDTRKLHKKYGVTAFPLDYPNAWDIRRQRTGDGIWVHGVLPGGMRRPALDTDGCLALPNEALLELQEKFVPLITPVIVTREIAWIDESARERRRRDLRDRLEQWVLALSSGDAGAYLSLYADDFRHRGMSAREWASFWRQTFERRGEVDVIVDEVLLMADPEEHELYVSRFRQTVIHGATASVTTTRLYWRRDSTGALTIIAEDNG